MDIRMICGDCGKRLAIPGSKPASQFRSGFCDACNHQSDNLTVVWKDEFNKAVVQFLKRKLPK